MYRMVQSIIAAGGKPTETKIGALFVGTLDPENESSWSRGKRAMQDWEQDRGVPLEALKKRKPNRRILKLETFGGLRYLDRDTGEEVDPYPWESVD
jgi:hypothetical protein